MMVFKRIFRGVLAASLIALTVMPAGCTKKPSQDELTRLEEAKAAAESAEKKLSDLRRERQQLEQTLSQKQGDLKSQETERDSIKTKMGK